MHVLRSPLAARAQDDGELRLQRILRALKGIADMLPQQASDGAAQSAQSLSPPRQEELAAAAGYQRAVQRMFGAHDKVCCHLQSLSQPDGG